jgi:hypothetical protein
LQNSAAAEPVRPVFLVLVVFIDFIEFIECIDFIEWCCRAPPETAGRRAARPRARGEVARGRAVVVGRSGRRRRRRSGEERGGPQEEAARVEKRERNDIGFREKGRASTVTKAKMDAFFVLRHNAGMAQVNWSDGVRLGGGKHSIQF